jgi:uncharacterized protein YdaU (DUF1376 family)
VVAVNYFEFHLGDYAKDAGHLTMLRDGAYLRVMSVYYSREKPLPLNLKECFELTRCTSKTERDAVEYVIKNFFAKAEDGYHQKRCDQEIERYQGKSGKARASANARWSHSEGNTDGMQTHSGRNTKGMQTHSEGNAPNLQSQSPIPISNNHPHSQSEGGGMRRIKSADELEAEERARAGH